MKRRNDSLWKRVWDWKLKKSENERVYLLQKWVKLNSWSNDRENEFIGIYVNIFQSDEQLKKLRIDKSTGESSFTDFSEKSSPAESLIEQPENYESSSETVVVDCDSLSNSSSQTFLLDDLANRYRKPPTRGAKRGRPRGSKRGNRGGLSRDVIVDIVKQVASSQETTESPYDSPVNPTVNKVRRGPGRPRLKPNGPSNQGNRPINHRPVQKYRKSIAPLVVPLGSSPAPTPTVRSPAMSPERL